MPRRGGGGPTGVPDEGAHGTGTTWHRPLPSFLYLYREGLGTDDVHCHGGGNRLTKTGVGPAMKCILCGTGRPRPQWGEISVPLVLDFLDRSQPNVSTTPVSTLGARPSGPDLRCVPEKGN